MSKEMKNVLIAIITLAINIIAPILMVDMIHNYTAKSFIVGTPDTIVKIENLDVNNYVFQENLSSMNFVNTQDNDYIFNYYFGAKDFNSSENNYLIYINDYMLSITNLESKSITGTQTRFFKDANGEICNEVNIEVTFEFYSTYSYLLVKLTTEDITYFNGFRENPGLVLTLSKVDYGMLGNLDNYKEIVTLQQQLSQLQNQYTILLSQFTELQNQYNQSQTNNDDLNNQILTLNNQIDTLNNQIIDLQAKLDAYNREGKYEVTFQSNGVTQEVVLVESSVGALTTTQVPTLEHTQSAHFAGWSVDGSTVVDPTTIDITTNITFIAVWNTMEGTWNFILDSSDDNFYIDSGEIIVANDTVEFPSDCFSSDTNYYRGSSSNGMISVSGDSSPYLIFFYNSEDDELLVYISNNPVPLDDSVLLGTATRN